MDEDKALRKAARAGIQLLEANKAFHEEVTALREQVAVLERERPNLRAQLETRTLELASMTETRKKVLIEASVLHNELKAKSALVTSLLEKEDLLKRQMAEVEAAKMLVENQVVGLQLELTQLRSDTAKNESVQPDFAIVNPAATYDSNQASTFTYADYEELQHRFNATLEENKGHVLEVKSLRKTVETLRRQVNKGPERVAYIERLEKQIETLQRTNDTLREERMEEQAVLDSLRSMNLVYKEIAESRPFAADCTCSQQPEPTDLHTLGVTVRDVLIEKNMDLEAELRELRSLRNLPHFSAEKDQDKALEGVPKQLESNSSNGSTGSDTASCGESIEIANERLSRKLQIVNEKNELSKEMLRHTTVQWCAAIASQKALEECNKSAQTEVSRLRQQLEETVSAQVERYIDASKKEVKARENMKERNKWTEETAPFPAPPGDLNSPLIKRLLDHWTTDKVKVMALTDWLHNSIRGTGRSTPLRLANLSSEIAAGFTQLLVPIMRERHGVSVSIYRRDRVHVLSDLVLQTNHPSVTIQTYSTAACNDKVVPTGPFDLELQTHQMRTQKPASLSFANRMLTDKYPDSSLSSRHPSASNALLNNASTLFYASNFMESTMPETFLDLDPAGFFTRNSSHSSAAKRSRASSECTRAPSFRTAMNGCYLEPSHEPCTDEIPWTDLVFWLGNVSTGELVCSCAQCTQWDRWEYGANLLHQQRFSPYTQQQHEQRRQVSSRVPVINMPRIEGVN